ncbi:MAG: FAD-linked oxidase C-terminal domain-containing protein [Verrucomicrobiota bacterium]
MQRNPVFSFEYSTSATLRKLYATDASEYQELPAAVAYPETDRHIQELIHFAQKSQLSLIPRTAGTSLAGQVVGSGIIVDCGRHMNQVLAIDSKKGSVRVQPGVVRNELNLALHPYQMFFGPETSTANRAMIGGMVGNNSCGSNSIVYGSVRDHLMSCRGFLSDGSEVTFEPLTLSQFEQKCSGTHLEARIYREFRSILSNPANRSLISDTFPKPSIPRRNTGYALDQLMDTQVFIKDSGHPFNLCKLIAGSEGTLFFGVEFELNCSPLPPSSSALLCAHFKSVDEALRSVRYALNYKPHAVELIDHHILEATKRNIEHQKNRFFVEGDPGAILVIDIRRSDESAVDTILKQLSSDLKVANLGYHYPILKGENENKVWELRRAGQGLMNNVPRDIKPREVVEDTAVDVTDLPEYISEFDRLMRERHEIECVYYAHAGSGELHTRPLFNLKTKEGVKTFRAVAEDIAKLVRKYKGSLSGEHGDGRLRGEFIPLMVGNRCYTLMQSVKEVFDPNYLFNPGKIINTPPMDQFLRYQSDQPVVKHHTIFDFSETQGILRATEQCNGSGDCRKGHLSGGTMCPSYMATRNEKDTTRARANILRHLLTNPSDTSNPFNSEEIKDVMDLCLSCKGCKSECPSNVDIAKLKAEFLQHYYDSNGVPLRTYMIAHFTLINRIFSHLPQLWNGLFGTKVIRRALNRLSGFHPDRTIPLLPPKPLSKCIRERPKKRKPPSRQVYFFADEFTEFNDVSTGKNAIELLERLGYEVVIPKHVESARTWLSKGMLRKAQTIAVKNVKLLAPLISERTPLIGIEPSAILGFRDEYLDLMPADLKKTASALSHNCLMFEEFFIREFDAGNINSEQFTDRPQLIKFHGHCFQKSLASVVPSVRALEVPKNYEVQMIPSGCCGMAGSFGYEKEHYEISMKIGELVLFPTIRNQPSNVVIAAPGTSCRHQIHDGTGRIALHPAQILYQALRS